MATDLTVQLENRPGALAELGEALGNAGINIDGIAGFEVDGRGMVHLLVDDASRAREAIQGAGVQVQGETEVVVVDVQDKPGELGTIARRIADAGANITLGYIATNNRLVLGGDDVSKIRQAVGR